MEEYDTCTSSEPSVNLSQISYRLTENNTQIINTIKLSYIINGSCSVFTTISGGLIFVVFYVIFRGLHAYKYFWQLTDVILILR